MKFVLALVIVGITTPAQAKYAFLPVAKYSFVSDQPETQAVETSEDQGYPVRRNWWTVNGRYPGKSEMVSHLLTGQHSGKFSREWLESLTVEELHSLHSDDHEGRAQGKKAAGRDYQIIVVSPSWCGACQVWKSREFPKFKQYGWTVGKGKHVEVVSDHPQAAVYPTFLIMKEGKVHKKYSGSTKAEVLMSTYNKMVTEK